MRACWPSTAEANWVVMEAAMFSIGTRMDSEARDETTLIAGPSLVRGLQHHCALWRVTALFAAPRMCWPQLRIGRAPH